MIYDKSKQSIIDDITKKLATHDEIICAYIFGSFVSEETFRDIDIAILIDTKKVSASQHFEYILTLGAEFRLAYPIDIILLNDAPAQFQANVFRDGKLLINKNSEQLSNLIESASLSAVRNASLIRESTKALAYGTNT
ncbi:MAG: nucleotidyltransferase domain-containing protein [Candidatus Magasanikbacteria bacterium]|nr:nucleotidyltransferase domain-containing protein [Candidatus Magasanikbacteria bacterium]